MAIKVLVVDDTIVYRKIVGEVLAGLSGVEVVGTAGNGRIALSRIQALKPDLLTLDIEMPEMDGLELLEEIRRQGLDVGAVMVSALTVRGSQLTMKALELGAFDFITKPEGGFQDENREKIRQALQPLIKAYAHQREIRSLLKGPGGQPGRPAANRTAAMKTADSLPLSAPIRPWNGLKAEIVGIGVSTGGPNALTRVLPRLPRDFPRPVLIVQHMPPLFTHSLAQSLDAKCALRVKEAEEGETIQNGTVYIAPGGKQMKAALGADGTTKIIRVTDDPPENNCKPSADYLFRSLAHHYLGRAAGVIMTGMGGDGTLGLRLMKRHGSRVVAQDEATCVVFGMPREAIAAGVVDTVVPLDRIADEILRTAR